MNVVGVIGVLEEALTQHPELRKFRIKRDYQESYSSDNEDIVYVMNWNKETKGELDSYKEKTVLAIKGRIENYLGYTVIIAESIKYLGKE